MTLAARMSPLDVHFVRSRSVRPQSRCTATVDKEPGPVRTLGKIGWRGNAFCERILRVTFCVVHERTLHACNRSTGCG